MPEPFSTFQRSQPTLPEQSSLPAGADPLARFLLKKLHQHPPVRQQHFCLLRCTPSTIQEPRGLLYGRGQSDRCEQLFQKSTCWRR